LDLLPSDCDPHGILVLDTHHRGKDGLLRFCSRVNKVGQCDLVFALALNVDFLFEFEQEEALHDVWGIQSELSVVHFEIFVDFLGRLALFGFRLKSGELGLNHTGEWL
jgi:hypothetical protein